MGSSLGQHGTSRKDSRSLSNCLGFGHCLQCAIEIQLLEATFDAMASSSSYSMIDLSLCGSSSDFVTRLCSLYNRL